jgi:hypothetical protein
MANIPHPFLIKKYAKILGKSAINRNNSRLGKIG